MTDLFFVGDDFLSGRTRGRHLFDCQKLPKMSFCPRRRCLLRETTASETSFCAEPRLRRRLLAQSHDFRDIFCVFNLQRESVMASTCGLIHPL